MQTARLRAFEGDTAKVAIVRENSAVDDSSTGLARNDVPPERTWLDVLSQGLELHRQQRDQALMTRGTTPHCIDSASGMAPDNVLLAIATLGSTEKSR